VSTDISEEHIASVFRVEEIGSANQRASRWQAEQSLFLTISRRNFNDFYAKKIIPVLKHQILQTYGEVLVRFQPFLTSAIYILYI
jgi:hypothetical protein